MIKFDHNKSFLPARLLGFMLTVLLAGMLAGEAQAARRALVIGNATYADGPLRNPVNDARVIDAKLAGWIRTARGQGDRAAVSTAIGVLTQPKQFDHLKPVRQKDVTDVALCDILPRLA